MRDTLRRCSVCGETHWLSEWPHNHVEAESKRSHLSAPMVISDNIDPVRSMADGKEYTSKAALRSTYKPSGNPDGISYAEVGNEVVGGKPAPKVDEKAIHESLNKALARYDRGERPNPR